MTDNEHIDGKCARCQELEADNARLREGLEKIQASPIGYGDTFNGSVEMGGRPTCPECIEKVRAAEEALSRTPAQALEREKKREAVVEAAKRWAQTKPRCEHVTINGRSGLRWHGFSPEERGLLAALAALEEP